MSASVPDCESKWKKQHRGIFLLVVCLFFLWTSSVHIELLACLPSGIRDWCTLLCRAWLERQHLCWWQKNQINKLIKKDASCAAWRELRMTQGGAWRKKGVEAGGGRFSEEDGEGAKPKQLHSLKDILCTASLIALKAHWVAASVFHSPF